MVESFEQNITNASTFIFILEWSTKKLQKRSDRVLKLFSSTSKRMLIVPFRNNFPLGISHEPQLSVNSTRQYFTMYRRSSLMKMERRRNLHRAR